MKTLKDLTRVFAFIFSFFVISISAQQQQQADDSIYTLQAGTTIQVKMDNEINSRVSSVNDTFTVTVSKPVIVRETEILPVGTIIEGRITNVKPASMGGANGSFEVRFETLRLVNGAKRPIEAVLTNLEKPKSTATRNIISVIGGTALGALIGTATNKENGALIGAGIGAGAGTSAVLMRKGKEARIRTDEEIEIRLKKDVTLPVEDY
jgi:preprotein translocase subunit YajC